MDNKTMLIAMSISSNQTIINETINANASGCKAYLCSYNLGDTQHVRLVSIRIRFSCLYIVLSLYITIATVRTTGFILKRTDRLKTLLCLL